MRKLLDKYLLRNVLRSPDEPAGDDTTQDGDDKAGDDKGGDDKPDKPADSKLKGGLLDRRTAPDGKDKKDPPPQPGKDGRPAHIPEKFWDPATKSVKSEDLAKAYGSLEKAHGDLKRSKGVGDDVPATAEEYFPAEGLKLEKADRFGNAVAPDDPGLKTWGKVALKWGVGKDAAIGMAKDMFAGMTEHAPAPVDPDAEFEKLGAGGQELVDGVFVWAEGLERQGKFGEADIQQVIDLSSTAEGIRFLAKVRGMTGERPIPLGDPKTGGRMSQEEWHSAMREAVKAKDYKEQERLDGISANIFGDEPSTGSTVAGIPNQKDVDRRKPK